MDEQRNSPNRSSTAAEPVRSRWTPKPEQILILESIFNSGMVNPPKEETVRIRMLLERFGSVGDANVFYWFQNRRSRSRRRQRQLQTSGLAADPRAARQVGGAVLHEPSSSSSSSTSSNNSSGGGSFFPCSFSASSSFSSLVVDDRGGDDLFSISRQMGFMGSGQIPCVCPSLDHQPGTITVFINGIPSEVPRGPIDLRATFGQNVMLVHSSGELLPINEYGILLQSLQMGESYFLCARAMERDRVTTSLARRPSRGYATFADLGRRIGRCELSIFDADRCSKEHDAIRRTIILNGPAQRCRLSAQRGGFSLSLVDGHARHGPTCSFYAMPTASSKASWNSHLGLALHGSVAVTASALRFKWPSSVARRLFGRSCPCSGMKSVDVEEKCSQPRSPIRSGLDLRTSLSSKNLSFSTGEVALSSIPEGATREEINDEFGFEETIEVKITTPGSPPQNPDLFSLETPFSAEIGCRMANSSNLFCDSDGFTFSILNPSFFNLAEEPPRTPLEVFRPSKETAVFPFSDHAPIPKPPLDDDAASDASSDLFEIESFSTQTTYRHRDSLDSRDRLLEAPPPTGVSVTTAEGLDCASLANFPSAASACGELRFAAAAGGRWRGSGLLRCRSEKAVSVGPNPVRVSSPVG
ncbi:WUSCHEL-related homeobox, partial [Musa troglodytarum]